MPEEIVTRILRLPGYGVYAWEADEATNPLVLGIRQTAREPFYVCRGCGIGVRYVHSWTERRLRDLPWGTWQVWRRVEVHRVDCPRCGVRTERLPFVTGKARSPSRFEAAVAQACEHAPVSRVAAQWGLAPETVRRWDKRALQRWAAARPRRPLHYLGVDEFFVGKRVKFLTVVSDLVRGEPIWVGPDRKRETLDRFFTEALPPVRRRGVWAVCVDMWEPFRLSLQDHLPHARIVYDKFHVLRHASEALDETRRAESFRQGAEARGLVRGKRWLLLRSWANLDRADRQTLRDLFALNRRLAKAHLLKEQLAQLLELDGNGKRLHVLRRINEEQAAVVRRIFELCVGGMGFTRIAKALNRDGVTPPRGDGRGWAPTAVREMLYRPLYRGQIVWNKSQKIDRGGTRKQRRRPPEEWIQLDAPELRIVTEELWEAAHTRLDQAREAFARARGSGQLLGRPSRLDLESPYLLTGMARCARCGGAMIAMTRSHGKKRGHFYGCAHNHKRGAAICPNDVQIRQEVLDLALLDAISRALDERIVEAVIDEALKRLRSGREEQLDRRTQIERELS
jgi:transposase